MLIPRFLKSNRGAAATLLSVLLANEVQAQNDTQTLTGFPACDALIGADLGHAVVLPTSPRYDELVNGTAALGTRRRPWCFVLPRDTAEVAQTLVALEAAGNGAGDWAVAIRSGGHGSDRSNNIEEGVTIDLGMLNTTTYDADSNIARVGPGARWGEVFAALEDDGVIVAGGRESVVGVGGLLLGGGISWYIGREGYSCDNVVNFEVVLANGTVINANQSCHKDLWLALKGGGSNFGIVTRFDIEAFPASNLTIEDRPIAMEHADEFVDALVSFVDLDQSYDANALIALVSYSPVSEVPDGISLLVTEVNTRNEMNTTAYDDFKRIPALAPTEKKSMTAVEAASRSGEREPTLNVGAGPTFFANDARVLHYLIEQHAGLVEDLKATVGPKAFSTVMDFQPQPYYFADIGVQKGGNMLGLHRSRRNKILTISAVTLLGPNSEEQYPAVYQKLAAMRERVLAFAKSVGCYEEFKYMPYGDATQDVIGSYGEANVAHLRSVASKYDPDGFFQHMVPGGFKISRVE